MDWGGFEQFVIGTILMVIFMGLFLLISRRVFGGISTDKKEQMAEERKVGTWFLGAIAIGLLVGFALQFVLVRVFSLDRVVADTIGRSLAMAIALFFGSGMWRYLSLGKL